VLLLVVTMVATSSLLFAQENPQPATASPVGSAQIALRVQAKAEAVLAEIQKQAAIGNVHEDVIAKMQKLKPLGDAGKLEEAEALLDEALEDLGVEFDPSTLPSMPKRPDKLNDDKQVSGDSPEQLTEAKERNADDNRSVIADPHPKFNPDGFTKIFSGVSLAGWDGDPIYWSVEDGKLVGTVSPETLLENNSWILWRGGIARDFELVLDYRVSAQGNSGVGYRLAVLEGDPFSVRGPQADIDGTNRFTGICYEEHGRRLLAARGQLTWIDPGTYPRLVAQLADPEELQGVVRKENWNQYRLIVKGNDAKHFVNGFLMSEVHDHDETNRMKAGLIGMQVHVGPPMKVEFRNIYLKHIGDPPKGEANRGSARYRHGDRLELEHSASFENLVKQTTRLTAPVTSTQINEQNELDILTRDMAIVRHGLQNVRLPSGSKPPRQTPTFDLSVLGPNVFDLVVSTPDFVVRVPNAGFRLIGKPRNRDYHIRLEWNTTGKNYDLVDLALAERSTTEKPKANRLSFRLGEPAPLRQTTGARLPDWAADAHTFIMLPVRPDRARELHVSVNGAWGGIPGNYSILPNDREIQREYNWDQAAFAAAVREAGIIVPASINTIEGFHSLRESVPNLDEMACRNADGDLVLGQQMILMCSLNPDWVQWEIDTGKAAIDAGAQWILLDTPMGASFISGFLKAGFCDHCMANFEAFLKKHYAASELASRFGIYDFDQTVLALRLTAMQELTPMKESVHLMTTADARLFQEFTRCQEETNFATRKHLMETLYRYAKEQEKEVLFCTNAADLGTQNPGGHWIRGLKFADLADLFTYELNNDPGGRTGAPLTKMPRGKWAAFHKLAYAVHQRRSAALIHTQDSDLLGNQAKQGRSSLAWMATQAVEAYAANGAYIPFHVEFRSFGKVRMEKIWSRVFEHNRFVQEHQELYAGNLTSGSPVAMLFLLNERGRTIPAVFPSYLGLAQGFIEANCQFDVVFGGDDRYVKDRLTAERLESLSLCRVRFARRRIKNALFRSLRNRAVWLFVRSRNCSALFPTPSGDRRTTIPGGRSSFLSGKVPSE